jgi:broad specificity phosphatase PhoE
MKFVLIRHGESEGNVAHEINDDPQRVVNLTAKGRAQAAAAGDALREMRFSHAYASQFPRAQQTAEIILRQQGCALRIDPRINERRSGMDGLPVHVFNDLVRIDRLRTKPERGESFLEQMERLRGFLDEVAMRHPDGEVLVVSHQDPILAAVALTSDEPSEVAERHLGNCEWVELDWPENG